MFEFLYIVSSLLHLIAFYYGIKAWHAGQDMFMNSSPLNFFKSKLERKFWTVCVGTYSNVLFLIALPSYVIIYNAEGVGALEGVFVFAHITSALTTAIWHNLAFHYIVDLKESNFEGTYQRSN